MRPISGPGATVHVVEILLPLAGNDGRRFDRALFAKVREELIERFGGLTAYTRSPAEGVWDEGSGTSRDEIVIFEVMADRLERYWWTEYRKELERRFEQDEIVVRSREVERL
ncbi:MAG: hypothetical protein E6G94_16300 [Alphaproteobacteria bacterium]|nr:MAG: hypothetical protein E6G94_16300 [Alphaproteobacteria bacterium]